MYKIVYLNSFSDSLEKLIYVWENELEFPTEKIKKFVQTIEYSLKMVSNFPEMYENVSSLSNFSVPTYRILIGKQYAIFYRLNHDVKEVLVGAIFTQKQIRLSF